MRGRPANVAPPDVICLEIRQKDVDVSFRRPRLRRSGCGRQYGQGQKDAAPSDCFHVVLWRKVFRRVFSAITGHPLRVYFVVALGLV